jgi:acylphosphatase
MAELIRHYLISGRVQGVGFRAFTQRQALRHNLKGWVRNLADGRVEAAAKGSADLLEKFEELLRKGPEMSRVDSLTVAEWAINEENNLWSSFNVRKDGATSWESPK